MSEFRPPPISPDNSARNEAFRPYDDLEGDETIDDPDVLDQIRQAVKQRGGVALEGALGNQASEIADGDYVSRISSVSGETSEPSSELATQAHVKVEQWLDRSSNPEATREEVYILAGEIAAGKRAKEGLTKSVPGELESVPGDAENVAGLVISIKKQFEQIGEEAGVVRTSVNRVVGEMMNGRASHDELIGSLKRLEGQAELWVGESGQARGKGDIISDFSKKVVNKADNVRHHVEVAAINFSQDRQEIYSDPKAQEESASTLDAVSQTDAQSPKELEHFADGSTGETNDRFDSLERGARELQAAANRLTAGDMHDPLHHFPRRAETLRNVITDMRLGLQNGNSRRAEQAAHYLREQLEGIERSAAQIRMSAGENEGNVQTIGLKSQAMLQAARQG